MYVRGNLSKEACGTPISDWMCCGAWGVFSVDGVNLQEVIQLCERENYTCVSYTGWRVSWGNGYGYMQGDTCSLVAKLHINNVISIQKVSQTFNYIIIIRSHSCVYCVFLFRSLSYPIRFCMVIFTCLLFSLCVGIRVMGRSICVWLLSRVCSYII